LAACGSQVNQAKLRQGSNRHDHGAGDGHFGEPSESSGVNVAGISGTASTWEKSDFTITVQFLNGKVVVKQLSKVQR
jgi:hypothetical protein